MEGEGRSITVLSALPSISPFLSSRPYSPTSTSLLPSPSSTPESYLRPLGKRKESSHSTILCSTYISLPNQTKPCPFPSFLLCFFVVVLSPCRIAAARARYKKK